MTIAAGLAALAHREPDGAERDVLRALTATNAAAAIGEFGAIGGPIARLPADMGTNVGAAYRFGAMLHARTQDDFHPRGRVHVGAVALATVLGLAEETGQRLLDCLAAGYEVMGAISVVYAPDAQRRGFRPTGLFGPLAAAATAARCLGFNKATTANAIALAAARSGGTNQSWLAGSDEWVLEAGNAARVGIEAVLLTRAGFRGAPDAIEGRAGWARALFDDEGAGRLAGVLATPMARIPEVAVKPYPVSGIAQVATDLAARAHAEFGAVAIEGAIVHIARGEADYPGSANRGPFHSRSDALMSIVFCTAAALADGAVPLARLEDPNSLADRVATIRLQPSDELSEGQARLEVRVAGRAHHFDGRAADLLHPTWIKLQAAGAALATRSEASGDRVGQILAALAEAEPDAVELRALMEPRS